MTDFAIERRTTLPDDIDGLLEEAAREGVAFMDRLRPDHDTLGGYEGRGQGLWVARAGSDLAAVAVLSRDPFRADGVTGRLRFIYVRPAYRRQGLLGTLAELALAEARGRWAAVRLHTDSAIAARVYQRLGFVAVTDDTATHARTMSRSSVGTPTGD